MEVQKEPESVDPEVLPPDPSDQIRIEIILDASGKLSVNGPLANRVMFKGMLAEASRLLDEWHVNRASGPVIVKPGKVRL